MKNTIKYSLTIALLFVYLFSAIGFDIHTCSVSGTVQVVLPYGVPDCVHIHHHACNENGICNNIHHDNKCCSNKNYSLQDDYTDSRNQPTQSLILLLSDIIYLLPVSTDNILLCELEEPVSNDSEAPPLISIGYNKILNIWRL